MLTRVLPLNSEMVTRLALEISQNRFPSESICAFEEGWNALPEAPLPRLEEISVEGSRSSWRLTEDFLFLEAKAICDVLGVLGGL